MWPFKKRISPEIRKANYLQAIKANEHTEILKEDVCAIAGIHLYARFLEACKCSDFEELMLVREHENKYDKNAIAILRFNKVILGYFPAEEAAKFAPLIDQGKVIRVYLAYAVESDNYKQAVIRVIQYK